MESELERAERESATYVTEVREVSIKHTALPLTVVILGYVVVSILIGESFVACLLVCFDGSDKPYLPFSGHVKSTPHRLQNES